MKYRIPWPLILALSLFLIYEFLQLNMMNTLAPFLKDSLHLSVNQLGLVSSLFFYANLGMLFFSGTLLDLYSPKWLMAGGIGLSILGLILFIAIPSYETALAWRACAGISGGFSYLSIVKIISEKFKKNKAGFLIGATSWVIMPAGILAQTPFLFLIHGVGLSHALLCNALLGILVIVVLFVVLGKEHFERHPHPIGQSIKLSFGRLSNWAIALFSALANLPLFLLGAAWGDLYLTHVNQHISMTEASLISSMLYAGNMVGAPLLGGLSDRHKHRGTFLILGAVGYLISAILIMLVAKIALPLFLIVLFFLLGIATTQSVAYALIIDISRPQDVAKTTSLISFFSVGGGALSANLFASMVSAGHLDYQKGFFIILSAGCVLVALSLLLYPYLKRRALC